MDFEVILPFPEPIEHLILDDSISEVMVNGTERIFVEKSGFLEQVQGVSLSERSLLVCRQEHRSALGETTFPNRSPFWIRVCRTAAASPRSSRPVASTGITLTIRKFNSRHFDMEDLNSRRNA